MQPPPLPEAVTITYQVARDVILRAWWRRYMLRPRTLGSMSTMFGIALFCFLIPDGMASAGFVLLLFIVLTPINAYRALARAVDGNSQYTDPKAVEFSPTRIVTTGPNWKSELPWTTFKGFSEDPTYFYLHLTDTGFASIIPKSAFTSESLQKFREYATARNT
jgi:hypothetical protein